MAYVKFHTICDHCGGRGEEYCAHTLPCSECGADVCEECCDVHDPDPPGFAVCLCCAVIAEIEAAE